jgi:hypothetical protein
MSKVHKTSFSDRANPNCEERKFTVHKTGLEHTSSNTVYFDCPWCKREIKAYVWSICGGGKRCECGAIFSSRGVGYKLIELTEGEVNER